MNIKTNVIGTALVFGTFEGNKTLHITTEELEKFTELIVKECCEVADLARKCFDVANDGNEDEYLGTTADIKKFAELIVRECCKVADELHLYLPSMTAKKLIVRYFGVEK